MTGYTAGWNMPGCSPEVPFEHFDTFAEAINYLAETVDRFWDEDADGVDSDANEQADAKWIQVHTELHNGSPAHDDGTHTFLAYAGGFAWSITPDERETPEEYDADVERIAAEMAREDDEAGR